MKLSLLPYLYTFLFCIWVAFILIKEILDHRKKRKNCKEESCKHQCNCDHAKVSMFE